jgi:hypothetical protein
MRRILLAMLTGNALGLGANWAAVRLVLPWLWSGVNDDASVLARMGLVAASAILIAAPPVLWGALGAWLARREQLWIGLACGLWGFVLIGSVPAVLPIAAGVWYAPTVLVLLSSMLGGWMLDLRAQARSPQS